MAEGNIRATRCCLSRHDGLKGDFEVMFVFHGANVEEPGGIPIVFRGLRRSALRMGYRAAS